MPAVLCMVEPCNGRQFRDEEALWQHLRDSPVHSGQFGKKPSVQTQAAASKAQASAQVQSSPSPSVPIALPLVKAPTPSESSDSYCPRCKQNIRGTMTQHNIIVHPKVRCGTCDIFIYREDLEQHWKESGKHSMCLVCEGGLKDDTGYTEHARQAHPNLYCSECNAAYHSEDAFRKHLSQSDMHPTCISCDIGFTNFAEWNEHTMSVHSPQPGSQAVPVTPSIKPTSLNGSEPRHPWSNFGPGPYYCEPCKRVLKTAQGKFEHLRYSPHHWHCSPCNMGFMYIAEHEAHMNESHRPATSHVVAPPPETLDQAPNLKQHPTPSPAALVREPEKLALIPYTPPIRLAPIITTPADPVSQGPAEDVLEEETVETPKSDAAELQRSQVTNVESMPQRARAASAPPPSSLFAPSTSSTGGEYESSKWTADHSFISQMNADNQDTSVSPLYTKSSSSSRSSSTASSPCVKPVEPEVTGSISPLSTPTMSPRRSDSISSKGSVLKENSSQSPQHSAAPQNRHTSVSEESRGRSRRRDSGSSTPTSSVGPQETSRPRSVHRTSTVASQTSRGQSRTPSPTRPRSIRTEASNTDASRTRITDDKLSSWRGSPVVPQPRVSRWDCRVCERSPHEPVTTLCGHIFCHSCILKELATTLQCPVCKIPMLVRLHTRS